MYAKCGAYAKAKETFDELPQKDIVTWNALLSGYAQSGLAIEALELFERMHAEGVAPNGVTYLSALKACGKIGALQKGKEIHRRISGLNLLAKDVVVGNALLDMYLKCGAVNKAEELFAELPFKDVVTWNTLITGLAQHELCDEALICFERMLEEGLLPDSITFISVLKACSSLHDITKGESVHMRVHRYGVSEKEAKIGTALVDMYAKCGALVRAKDIFNQLFCRDVVTWNALISGYVQHGHANEALCCFEQMQNDGVSPSVVTFISVLNACAETGLIKRGEEIHREVENLGLLEENDALINALVDMYAKCGEIVKAQRVLDEHPACGVAAWTALIAGYAQIGNSKAAFDSFTKMIAAGIMPDAITFVTLLTACSHEGFLHEGQMYFYTMANVYKIQPIPGHFACMVDIFTRAGDFDKAASIIKTAPSLDRLLLWSALMGACREELDLERAKWTLKHVTKLYDDFEVGSAFLNKSYVFAGIQHEPNRLLALE
ncbi:hypothetical protein KP509_10G046000 [Ceratopteris richardii]|nr:hypothetical protein KP509_10G046000 [Ceratopteris richardii]